MIADEDDLADQRDRAVVDLEHDVHAILIEPDDLRIDTRIVVATLGVQIEDFLAVLLGQCRREHRPRPELHFRAKLVVAELVVALERDAVHQRIFDQTNDQRVAFAVEPHILEQAGGVEGLEAAVEPVRIERIAWLDQHIGQDRAGLDPLIALDLDRRDRVAAAHGGPYSSRAGRGRRRRTLTERSGTEPEWQ